MKHPSKSQSPLIGHRYYTHTYCRQHSYNLLLGKLPSIAYMQCNCQSKAIPMLQRINVQVNNNLKASTSSVRHTRQQPITILCLATEANSSCSFQQLLITNISRTTTANRIIHTSFIDFASRPKRWSLLHNL